jgi:hypothetical protein
VHIEQNQINLGSRVKSLSLAFLLKSQLNIIRDKNKTAYKAIAKEKSILIIFCGKVNFYHLPVIRGEPCLLDKEVITYITHT